MKSKNMGRFPDLDLTPKERLEVKRGMALLSRSGRSGNAFTWVVISFALLLVCGGIWIEIAV